MSDIAAQVRELDAADPLRGFRDEFLIPPHGGGEQHYFVGNSLGLQPRAARAHVLEVLDKWAAEAVEGHFSGDTAWMDYHRLVRDPLARLVGALPEEVVAMNTLTVNLHLMLASFYCPDARRSVVLMEAGAFPSDRHAVESQIRLHGLDPAQCLVEVEADQPDGTLSDEAIARAIAAHGPRLALVLWPGIQYRTGQAFDLARIAALAHAQGARAGFDLAHAVGNLPLALHDAGADFAVWCHYKYVNAGPGAVAGCFVHQRHGNAGLPRMAGWWGHEASTRFRMAPEFVPAAGAEGWQLSNPPVLAMAPLRASLEQFERAGGMAALRAKSERLTGLLERLIHERLADTLQVVTPADPQRRGCQLSLRVAGGRERGRALFEHLRERGFLGDWREPDVIRIAPVPLYNRYAEVLALVEEVERWRSA
ncbi:kynureninase [Pseudoxanthomonas sp. SGNA-20]|uniref:kynureninase n=1 Tax=Pseudoxanthomonas sp. SGNA-20 TaxID=2493088 RepID=UPI000F638933|nr:kynureninase [Pseudoxanthomonas sp. SGNA-20]RRN57199.1 kynureninase [Pseudoxanthomonas sp. SGNA-20]